MVGNLEEEMDDLLSENIFHLLTSVTLPSLAVSPPNLHFVIKTRKEKSQYA